METNLSLDDIIQRKFPKSANSRGKRGGPGGRRGQIKPKGDTSVLANQNKKINASTGLRKGGVQRRRGGLKTNAPIVGDARSRIIQQKRLKLTDAREKLGEIAHMSDARLKLNKLHGRPTGAVIGKAPLRGSRPNMPRMRGGITVQTGRNGQIQLSTNKKQGNQQQRKPFRDSEHIMPMGRGRLTNTIPNLLDIDLELEDDPPPLGLIRRTVNNSILSHHALPIRQREDYTWTKPAIEDVMELDDTYERVDRNAVTVRPQILRHSVLQPALRRPLTNTIRLHGRSTSPELQVSSDWYGHREPPLKRTARPTIIQPAPRPNVAPDYSDDDEEMIWQPRAAISHGVKSRLDTPSSVPHSMGILAAESKASAVPASRPAPSYHRIIVSNLQKSVTNEDIRELFEDIGSLVQSKLVRPGTAEVVYRSRKDAIKAVDIYHNRQLDGEPMKCMLVNPRPLPSTASTQHASPRNTRPIGTSSTSHFRGATTTKFPASKKSTVFPDIDTIHKALFKR